MDYLLEKEVSYQKKSFIQYSSIFKPGKAKATFYKVYGIFMSLTVVLIILAKAI